MILLICEVCGLCRRDLFQSSDVAHTVSGRAEVGSASLYAYLHIALVTSHVADAISLERLSRTEEELNQVSFQVSSKSNKHEMPRGPPEFHLGLGSFSALCWKP